MKIGIMGGTFDPVHNGHLILAEAALMQYHLDTVWFLPNGHPPHKQQNTIECTIEDRIHMLELAIAKQPSFGLELYETKKTDIAFSADTLEYLSRTHAKDHLYFIIGGDSLMTIESWVRPEDIFRYSTVLATYRNELNTKEGLIRQISHLTERYRGDIRLFETPILPISSRELRRQIRSGQPVSGMLPPEVEAYIRKKGLYGARDSLSL